MKLTFLDVISLAATILAPILSGVFAYLGSRLAAKTQINTTAQSTFISARLDAYRAYEEAFELWSKEKSIASRAAVYRAENAVRLVASEETVQALGSLTEYVRLHETTKRPQPIDAIASAHAAALLSMRSDLLHYPIPKPLKREGESKSPIRA